MSQLSQSNLNDAFNAALQPQAAVAAAVVPSQPTQITAVATASVFPQQQQQCDTCPMPPVSQAVYTRTRQASFGAPSILSQTVDRCTGAVVSQTEQLPVVFTTSPWTLSAGSSVAPQYQQFVPASFNTL